MLSRLYMLGAGGSLLVAMALGLWYQNSQIESLGEQIERLRSTLNDVYDEQSTVHAKARAVALDLADLNQQLRDTSDELNKLRKKYAKHNFTELVRKKPGLVDRRINRATDKLFNEFKALNEPEGGVKSE